MMVASFLVLFLLLLGGEVGLFYSQHWIVGVFSSLLVSSPVCSKVLYGFLYLPQKLTVSATHPSP